MESNTKTFLSNNMNGNWTWEKFNHFNFISLKQTYKPNDTDRFVDVRYCVFCLLEAFSVHINQINFPHHY